MFKKAYMSGVMSAITVIGISNAPDGDLAVKMLNCDKKLRDLTRSLEK